MKNRRKLLVVVPFLIAGVLFVGHAFAQSVVINYLVGIALSLIGSSVWVCAE